MEYGLQESKVLLATSLFIIFIVWDIGWIIATAYIKGVYWIPDKALVLSGLTVQLLGYFDSKNIKFFDKSIQGSESKDVLIENQLAIHSARLCFCVFLGYVQPAMAFAGSGGSWSNIAALSISLSFHIATEVYVLTVNHHGEATNTGFVSCSLVLLTGAICLVIYLSCTLISCKFIRDALSEKIPEILSENMEVGPEGDKLSNFRGEVLKSWTVARTWKAQYKIASSAFIPAVGVIVTICVAVVGANFKSQKSVLYNSKYGGLTLYLQFAFVLIGWIVIISRWFMVASYYAGHTNRILLDDYRFARRTRKLIFLYMRIALHPGQHSDESLFECIPSSCMRKVVWIILRILTWIIFLIVLIPLGLLIVVIRVLFHFSFFSWLLSASVFYLPKVCASYLSKLEKTEGDLAFPDVDNEFLKFKEPVKRMFVSGKEDKDLARLWKYLERSFTYTKLRMKKNSEKSKECKELLSVIKGSVLADQNCERVATKLQSKRMWKMAAVAIMDVMVQLTEFDCGLEADVKNMMKAYKQAADLLGFLDYPDNVSIDPMNLFATCNIEAFETSLEADNHILKLERRLEKTNGQQPGRDAEPSHTVDDLLNFVKEKQEICEQQKREWNEEAAQSSGFCLGNCSPLDFFFLCFNRCADKMPCFKNTSIQRPKFCSMYRVSKNKALTHSLLCVYQVILAQDCYSDKQDFVQIATNCLGDVIAGCLEQLPRELVRYSNKWAEEFQEDKINKALEIAEKLSTLKEIMSKKDEQIHENTPELRKAKRPTVEEEKTKLVREIEEESRVGSTMRAVQSKDLERQMHSRAETRIDVDCSRSSSYN